MEKIHPETKQHTLHMERRKTLEITGVMDVNSFHETEVVLKVDNGFMVVTGQDLHIGKLLLDDGRLDISGQIDGILYEQPKANVRKWFAWNRGQK